MKNIKEKEADKRHCSTHGICAYHPISRELQEVSLFGLRILCKQK